MYPELELFSFGSSVSPKNQECGGEKGMDGGHRSLKDKNSRICVVISILVQKTTHRKRHFGDNLIWLLENYHSSSQAKEHVGKSSF